MDNPIPAIAFGLILVVIAVTMMRSLRGSRQEAENSLNKDERRYLLNRARRRSQVAGMILIIGVMIPIGDSLIDWKEAPGTFAVYWIIVMTLALWAGLLAIGDMTATRAFMARELNRLHRHQMDLHEMARQAASAQNETESNGSSTHG
ncbi:hypothetical protein SH668x_002480 [Planctomicrobium sp. SH668]|uniref:hypothetical protein n=1 Tax=Planctomicrobium sp. SH668 TaxID=3448126 RepID=UPI003F5C2FB3